MWASAPTNRTGSRLGSGDWGGKAPPTGREVDFAQQKTEGERGRMWASAPTFKEDAAGGNVLKAPLCKGSCREVTEGLVIRNADKGRGWKRNDTNDPSVMAKAMPPPLCTRGAFSLPQSWFHHDSSLWEGGGFCAAKDGGRSGRMWASAPTFKEDAAGGNAAKTKPPYEPGHREV